MASSTPSVPITSSRGAADTTAGRIYFSVPSAQVRVPVWDLVFPPPPTYAHTILLGGKTIRRRNNYHQRAPNYTLSSYIEPNYTLSLYLEPNYTLS